ncbi:hypothetical protein HCN44_004541 [Aphidius gifuensis]|uniref:Probable RNA polymerase II nuclear localization protein SLC7A6OS n=1 Tax=Aphidius gifuensis TaxID=684658 RepID=A0A835CSJ8_APHGI|nr:probable RNA polymerase II nuclear localization protein SLC7A6OS [Aphidius gifuensis]KAF7995069.1 hypothetical protein HCN44_004541 [Aphidius gifuensis]
MATVLRIKRRLEDEPLDHLLISCKRRKVDETEEAPVEQNLHRAVVKFAGTLDNQDINIAKHLKNQTKHDLETNYKKLARNKVIEKSRIKVKESSKQNRWKVINCSRAVDDPIDEDDDVSINDNGMTIIDVEDCSTELPNDKVAKYVYDIYYTEDNNDELSFDSSISIHEMEEGWLVNDDYREGEVYRCDNPDDSDSNSESNWRNDYGEEEEEDDDDDDYYDNDNLVNEDDIVQALNRCGVNDEHDEFDGLAEEELSDDEDDYYNGKLDQADIDMGGILYAKYKAKLKYGEFESDEESEYDDDDDDDEAKSNSEMIICNGSIVQEISTNDKEMIN